MKIEMITTSAGPEGCLNAGKTYDLPSERAKALIKGGAAREIVQPAPEQEPEPEQAAQKPPAPETSSADPHDQAESADSPDQPPRPKKKARKPKESSNEA